MWTSPGRSTRSRKSISTSPRAEVYRGYRSLPVAASGLMGLAAAWLQPSQPFVDRPDGIHRLLDWPSRSCAACLGASEIVYNYGFTSDRSIAGERRRVVGQFLPSLIAGTAITLCLAHLSPALVVLLPGLWAICFGIGVVASRPYLPRASGAVALFYCACGVALAVDRRRTGAAPTAWQVGATFGVGQLAVGARPLVESRARHPRPGKI